MPSDVCPICQDLSARAVAAIAHHLKLVGKLDVAGIRLDAHAAAELQPHMEAALAARESAVEEYRRHRNSHLAAEAGAVG